MFPTPSPRLSTCRLKHVDKVSVGVLNTGCVLLSPCVRQRGKSAAWNARYAPLCRQTALEKQRFIGSFLSFKANARQEKALGAFYLFNRSCSSIRRTQDTPNMSYYGKIVHFGNGAPYADILLVQEETGCMDSKSWN